MLERASKLRSLEGEIIPGKWIPAALVRYPTVATIAQRPCFNSAARYQRRVSSEPCAARLKGSNWGRGRESPPISSREAESWVLAGCVTKVTKRVRCQ